MRSLLLARTAAARRRFGAVGIEGLALGEQQAGEIGGAQSPALPEPGERRAVAGGGIGTARRAANLKPSSWHWPEPAVAGNKPFGVGGNGWPECFPKLLIRCLSRIQTLRTQRPPGIDRSFEFHQGRYAEQPDDVVFTVGYSVRCAMTAAVTLLKFDKKPTAVYMDVHSPHVIIDAIRTMHR